MTSIVIVPGLHGSEPQHWQTWFQSMLPGCARVSQRDRRHAHLPQWTQGVRRELARAEGSVWLVAHNFGCLAAVQAAWDYDDRVAGCMLVAPVDPERFGVTAHLPSGRLSFASVIVASSDDPWMPLSRARRMAERWGSDFVELGAAGQINSHSGFGPWPEGLAILEHLRQSSVTRARSTRGPAIARPKAKAGASTARRGIGASVECRRELDGHRGRCCAQ